MVCLVLTSANLLGTVEYRGVQANTENVKYYTAYKFTTAYNCSAESVAYFTLLPPSAQSLKGSGCRSK